jgi:hypothetical protein
LENSNSSKFLPSAPLLTDVPPAQEEQEVEDRELALPPVVDEVLRSSKSRIENGNGNGSVEPRKVQNTSVSESAGQLVSRAWRMLLRRLSSLKLAIAELLVIAFLSALGE